MKRRGMIGWKWSNVKNELLFQQERSMQNKQRTMLKWITLRSFPMNMVRCSFGIEHYCSLALASLNIMPATK